jgi:putative tryptophan/tyrosine transport system substrate-binding protein
MNKIQASAAALGVRLDVLEASTDSEIEAAFAKVAQHSGAPIMLGCSRRAQIVSFAARYAVPVMYVAREFTEAGGQRPAYAAMRQPQAPLRTRA